MTDELKPRQLTDAETVRVFENSCLRSEYFTAESVTAAYVAALAALRAKATPNPPLTLDELRKMDGEPVYIIFYSKTSKCGVWKGWALVDLRFPAMEFLEHNLKFEYYGKSWLAYRHKPEEDTKWQL